MNTVVTSREELLKASRALLQRAGWRAVNIRSVAAACGVSVGSIYNYFDSKAALISATVESIWSEIFRSREDEPVFQDTLSCMAWLYERMEYGSKQYPDFFSLHSLALLGEDKAEGKRQMQQTWQHISKELCAVLQRDANIRPGAFTEVFTAENVADLLFSLILSALLRRDYDPSVVLEIIRRTLY